MEPVLVVLGILFVLVGLVGIFVGAFDDDIPLAILAAVLFSFGVVFLVTSSIVPQCETKTVTPFTVTTQGKSYVVTKVKLCDNGTAKFKGSKPKKPVEVVVK